MKNEINIIQFHKTLIIVIYIGRYNILWNDDDDTVLLLYR